MQSRKTFCILSFSVSLLNVQPSLHEYAVWSENNQLIPAKPNAKAPYSPHFPKALICRVPENFLLAGFYNPCMRSIKRTDYIETNSSGVFYIKYTTCAFFLLFPNQTYGKGTTDQSLLWMVPIKRWYL